MVGYSAAQVDRALTMVRRACLCWPEVTERPSHGSPAFFVRTRRGMATFVDDHHGDGRLALWCKAPDGVQAELIDTEPDRFFRPPYVGPAGWVGVLLLDIDQRELDAICREAYRTAAPASLRRFVDRAGGDATGVSPARVTPRGSQVTGRSRSVRTSSSAAPDP